VGRRAAAPFGPRGSGPVVISTFSTGTVPAAAAAVVAAATSAGSVSSGGMKITITASTSPEAATSATVRR
jgi:hypothetical protein